MVLTNGAASIEFAYTGKYSDPETGLSYHWNRWFDPGLGKWLTPDPLGDADLYRYVGNHPTGAIDPSGLDFLFPNEVGETGSLASISAGTETSSWTDPVLELLNPGIANQYFDLGAATRSTPPGRGTVFTAPASVSPHYPQLTARPLTYHDIAIDDALTPAEQEAYYDAIEYETWRRRDTTGWYGSRATQIRYFEDRIGMAAAIRHYHDMSMAERMFRPDSIFDLNTAIMIVGVPAGPPRIGGFFEPRSPVIVVETVAPRSATGPAHNAANAARLTEHLRQWEKYGAAGFKELQNGRIRYYGNLTAPRTPGTMAGFRRVREWNPATGATRTWFETVDHAGRVRIVRPETGGPKIHYMFDEFGNFIGTF